jgi:hypothetical protein
MLLEGVGTVKESEDQVETAPHHLIMVDLSYHGSWLYCLSNPFKKNMVQNNLRLLGSTPNQALHLLLSSFSYELNLY